MKMNEKKNQILQWSTEKVCSNRSFVLMDVQNFWGQLVEFWYFCMNWKSIEENENMWQVSVTFSSRDPPPWMSFEFDMANKSLFFAKKSTRNLAKTFSTGVRKKNIVNFCDDHQFHFSSVFIVSWCWWGDFTLLGRNFEIELHFKFIFGIKKTFYLYFLVTQSSFVGFHLSYRWTKLTTMWKILLFAKSAQKWKVCFYDSGKTLFDFIVTIPIIYGTFSSSRDEKLFNFSEKFSGKL